VTLEALFGDRTALVIDGATDGATDGAIDDVAAAAARAQLAEAWRPYRLLDRGRHDVVEDPALHALPALPALIGALAVATSTRLGRRLAPVATRALRLGPGDYLLGHHDRVHDDHPIEATLDLSPRAVAGAEVHYRRRGQLFFRVPSSPRSLAIVERGPTVTCHHTYVSKLDPGALVIRLVVLLR
jgi:hypothetical protein